MKYVHVLCFKYFLFGIVNFIVIKKKERKFDKFNVWREWFSKWHGQYILVWL